MKESEVHEFYWDVLVFRMKCICSVAIVFDFLDEVIELLGYNRVF